MGIIPKEWEKRLERKKNGICTIFDHPRQTNRGEADVFV